MIIPEYIIIEFLEGPHLPDLAPTFLFIAALVF